MWCGTSRDALLPGPLAKKLPHGHRIKLAAAASTVGIAAFDVPGARPARSSPRGESADRPRNTRACTARYGLGCGAGQLSTRSSTAASGWWLRLQTPGDTAFDSRDARPARSSHRGASADRPRSTSACTAWYGLGSGAGQLATRSFPAPWPWLGRTTTASSRRLRLRTIDVTASNSRGARPARSSPCGEPADRPQNTRACTARCGLCCGAGKLVTRSSPVRWPLLECTAGASSRRLRLRTVGVTAFDFPGARPARSLPRGASADRPRSMHACTAQCGLGFCAGQLATRSFLALWPRLNRTATASSRRLRLCAVSNNALYPRGARLARSSPRGEATDRPRSTRWCTARCGLGCGVKQLATRSSPDRRPRRSRTATAPGQRPRLPNISYAMFGSRGVWPARSSPRGASADRPRSTHACTARCGLGFCAGQRATRSSPAPWPWVGRTATASSRRLQLRIVDVTAFDNPLRAGRALIAAWRIGRPPTEHARVLCAVRTWLWCGTSRDALVPSPLARKLPHGHRIKSAAVATDRRRCRIRFS